MTVTFAKCPVQMSSAYGNKTYFELRIELLLNVVFEITVPWKNLGTVYIRLFVYENFF